MDKGKATEESLLRILRDEEREDRATRPRSYGIGMGQERDMISANDLQYGGDHYKGADYQHWDFVHDLGLNYFAGNATKYVSRYRHKNGVEDLQKAAHYCSKAVELDLEDKSQIMRISEEEAQNRLFRFAMANNLTNDQYRIIFDIITGAYDIAGSCLLELIEVLKSAQRSTEQRR
jgi:hypothetical protein